MSGGTSAYMSPEQEAFAGFVLRALAVAVAISANDTPTQGVQAWKRVRLARQLAAHGVTS